MATRRKKIKHIKAKNIFKNISRNYIFVIAFLLCLIFLTFFAYKYFIKSNNYIVDNKYYRFSLTTPSRWIGEENTNYSENVIMQTIENCKNDQLSKEDYEIGAFRFKSKKYPQELDINNFSTTGLPSGIILEVKIVCSKDNSSNAVTIDEESKNIRKFVFYGADNIKYYVTSYINIAREDNNKMDDLIDKYSLIIDKIISSISIR